MEIAETPGSTEILAEKPARVGGLRKSLGWLSLAQLARLLLGFVVGTFVARALGTAGFGRFSTALGITTLAAFFAELGLRQVMVKEMAQRPRIAGPLMGAGFWLLVYLGLLALVICLVTPWAMGRMDLLTPTAVLSIAFLFNGHQAVLSRWDASGEGWRAPRFAIIASLVSNAAKVACIVAGLGVIAICGAIALECFVASALIAWSTWRTGWAHDLRRAHALSRKALLARAFPQFLAQSGAFLLLRLDQVMLNAMAGNEEAGIYGAATRLSELVFLFVPILVASYLPRLAAMARTNTALFRRTIDALLQLLSLAGLLAPLGWWLFGAALVRWVYGHEFTACGPVLFIHCLSSLAYLHGVIRSFVLVTEGRARLGAYAAFAGAAINIVLNLWWIPLAGAQGAAWATGVAYYAAWFAGTFFIPGLRWMAWSQVRSLAAPLTLAFRWRETLAALRAR